MADINERALLRMDEVKDELRIAATDSTWDGLLQLLINGITAHFERRCGRPFVASKHVSEKMDGTGSEELVVVGPIISIDNSGSITNGTVTVVSADYVLYSGEGRIRLTNGTAWATGYQNITISYTNGWERSELPDDVVLAARYWLQWLFSEIKNKDIGRSSKSKGQESHSNFDARGIPDLTRTLVDPYRWKRF